jgi:hypothetical protein
MSKSTGGAYLPNADYTRTGATDTGGTYVGATYTSSTLTAPTVTNPTVTTGTFTSPAIVSPTITGTPVLNFEKGNASTAQVAGGYSSDTYLAGSSIAIPTGGYVALARYVAMFDMVKTAAGTAQFTITLRIGTAGTTADAAICAFAFGAGTAAVDSGIFRVEAHFRTVGATTTAVVAGVASCSHALAVTGLTNTGASGFGQILTVSSGFDSTIASTIIGLSVNGGASFSGTNSIVQAELRSY